MAVKSGPGSSFEVIQPQFFLELLMRLFADPARLDRADKGLDRGVAGQIGEIERFPISTDQIDRSRSLVCRVF